LSYSPYYDLRLLQLRSLSPGVSDKLRRVAGDQSGNFSRRLAGHPVADAHADALAGFLEVRCGDSATPTVERHWRNMARLAQAVMARRWSRASQGAMPPHIGSSKTFNEATYENLLSHLLARPSATYKTLLEADREEWTKALSNVVLSFYDIYDGRFDFVRLHFWRLAYRHGRAVSSSRALFHE